MCSFGYDSLPFEHDAVVPGLAGAAPTDPFQIGASGGSSAGGTYNMGSGSSVGGGGLVSTGGMPPTGVGGFAAMKLGGTAALIMGGQSGMPAAMASGGATSAGGSVGSGGSGGTPATGGSANGGTQGAGGAATGGAATGGTGGALAGPPVLSWYKVYGSATGPDDVANSVCVDGSGNVQVGGNFTKAVNFGGGNISSGVSGADGFVASYSNTGSYRWANHPALAANDGITGFASAASGTAFALTIERNTLTFGGLSVATGAYGGAAVGVMDATGTPVWMKGAVLSASTFSSPFSQGVTVGASGRVYLFGGHDMDLTVDGALLTTTTGTMSAYLAMFDGAGTRLAASTLPNYEWVHAIEDPAQIYAFGNTVQVPRKTAIATYTLAGAYSSVVTFGGAGDDIIYDAARDSAGNLYITGSFGKTINFGGSNLTALGTSDIFVASFTSTLAHRWSMRFGSNFADFGSAITTDQNGNVYFAGSQQGAINFGGGSIGGAGVTSVFLVSFTSTGAHRWSQAYDGAPNGISAVTVAPDYSIYIAGEVGQPMDLLGTAISPVNGAASSGFLAKLIP